MTQDLTGQRFHLLTVRDFSHFEPKYNYPYWNCICDCGNETRVLASNLKAGKVKSCGCLAVRKGLETKLRNAQKRIGMKINKLTVVGVEMDPSGDVLCHCVCECGNRTTKKLWNIFRNRVKSCGCSSENQRKAVTTHGMTKSSTWRTWFSMRTRCNNPNHNAYLYYGARGIRVCDRWQNSFESFLEDMGDRPAGTTLDRIDVNGHYEPSNCRWATGKEQGRNKRNNRKFLYQGLMVSISELCEISGFSEDVMRYRLIDKGWDAERAVSTPIQRKTGHGGVQLVYPLHGSR